MNTTASTAERPTFGDMLREIVPLVGVIAGYGPPVISLAGPWVLLSLILAGPFAFLLTLLAVMVVAAAVVGALAAAVVAAPYLLIGHVRDLRARRAVSKDRAPQLVPVGTRQVTA
jgi:hypothetical protein